MYRIEKGLASALLFQYKRLGGALDGPFCERKMTSSRAALLLLCALAGVESFGYFDPGAISACTTATDWGSCAPTSGCYWDESTHYCMDDPMTIYNGNQVDCESAGGSYAETMAATSTGSR